MRFPGITTLSVDITAIMAREAECPTPKPLDSISVRPSSESLGLLRCREEKQ